MPSSSASEDRLPEDNKVLRNHSNRPLITDYLLQDGASNVTLYKRGHYFKGDLHLTNHHLIFIYQVKTADRIVPKELWLSYPIIDNVELKSGSCLLDVIHLSNQHQATKHLLDENSKERAGGTSRLETVSENDAINVIQNLRDIAKLYRGACLKIKCKDFLNITIDFNESDIKVAKDVFETIKKLTCVTDIRHLYAFLYEPIPIEAKFNSWNIYNIEREFERQGLNFKSLQKDDNTIQYPGQNSWRISTINESYQFCETYSKDIIVPKSISDSVLKYAAKFRSKNRIPSLTYYFKKNGCTLTRSSQPLTGLSQSRSIQDEKLIYEIFMSNRYSSDTSSPSSSSSQSSTSSSRSQLQTPTSNITDLGNHNDLIVDARPTANAMAQTALGAGTEIIDNYKNCKRKFLGIDNIHVMRDSLMKIYEVLKDSDILLQLPMLNSSTLSKSNWLKNLTIILNGVDLVVKSLFFNNNHVMVHCSDGWDRTTQICSLAEICLDPYYRTLEGFIVLIEKDWSSFGHRFKERSGHLSSETKFVNNLSSSNGGNNGGGINGFSTDTSELGEASSSGFFDDGFGISTDSILNSDTINTASKSFNKLTNHFKKKKHIKFTSPIFQQFLDAVYQLFIQFPEKFEFNERFLRRLVYHLHSCQYGNFLVDNEHEKFSHNLHFKTRSVWDYFLSRRQEFANQTYKPPSDDADDDIILPNSEAVRWWYQLYGRSDEEMNGLSIKTSDTNAVELEEADRLNKKLANIVHRAATGDSNRNGTKNPSFGKATRETNINIMKHNIKKSYNDEFDNYNNDETSVKNVHGDIGIEKLNIGS
ncbi:phosphatidylinositol-3-phosphatase [Saccharomycopsis crataegensis]|uniref:Phosphatidylinositol-3-phosphatase n=1 Tax=Saccharomycopsis crataegensis TaxID=43959 RepID=A0AAV5QU34_9ASCO|nr:phosphatidylinositol-3-phosphatase [Saccharomycopsis crataegensis]